MSFPFPNVPFPNICKNSGKSDLTHLINFQQGGHFDSFLRLDAKATVHCANSTGNLTLGFVSILVDCEGCLNVSQTTPQLSSLLPQRRSLHLCSRLFSDILFDIEKVLAIWNSTSSSQYLLTHLPYHVYLLIVYISTFTRHLQFVSSRGPGAWAFGRHLILTHRRHSTNIYWLNNKLISKFLLISNI